MPTAAPLFSQDSSVITSPAINEEGISHRLLVDKNHSITFPGTSFSFGTYKEIPSGTAAKNYSSSGYGVSLAMHHHIRGIWSGSIEARWSDWLARSSLASGVVRTNISPLSLYSKVEASLPVENLTKNLFVPYFKGGVGYTAFFDSRSLIAARSKTAFGETSITYGGGFRINIPKSIALKFSFENWRGLETSEYAAQIYRVEISFGDMDAKDL